MRKIFLFLFAAVLSIGTAMAANLDCADATVTLERQNLILQGNADSGEKLTVMLWQGSTGAATGQYPVGDYDIILNNVTYLTAETAGVYTVMGNMFTFEATATDGSTQYSIYMMGSTESSTPETGEMEAKDAVEFSYYGEGVWSVEAYADDSSWGMQLELAFDEMTGEYNASGYYITDLMTYDMVEVAGTGLLYYDDFTGRMVFKANSLTTSNSQEIYPILYASSMDLGISKTTFPAEASPWEDYGHTGYSYILLASDDWNWTLELNIKNFNRAGDYSLDNPTYEEEVWNDYLGDFETVTKNLYSKYNENIPVMGDVTVYEDEGLLSYECELYTVDAEGNMGTMLYASVMESNAETFDIEADNATVAEGTYYPLEFTCTWNDGDMDHSVKVEVVEVKYGQEVPANFIFDGGMMNDGDQAEGVVIVTKDGNTATVVGEFEGRMGGDIYNVTLSGTVPANILETIVLVDGEDNSTLLAKYNGQKVNVQVENRSLVAEEYNTLVVPFDMPASEIGVAYELTGVVSNSAEELEVNFTKVTTILAGKPYIVIPNKGFYGFGVEGVVIKNVAASTITKSCKTATVAMQGVMNTIAGKTTDGLYWIGESGYLYNDEADLLGMRAYFNITTQSGIAPRMRVVTKENEATGVENITTGAAAVKTIENGQLIIIRDNVKYNLQGQIVK